MKDQGPHYGAAIGVIAMPWATTVPSGRSTSQVTVASNTDAVPETTTGDRAVAPWHGASTQTLASTWMPGARVTEAACLPGQATETAVTVGSAAHVGDRHPVDKTGVLPGRYAAAMPADAAIDATETARKSAADCLFCRIVSGQIPAEVVREGARTLAFRDIKPQAPTHVLVVTREHYRDMAELAGADPELAGALLAEATEVADGQGLAGVGYRIVLNTGAEAGQTVFHVHAHVLGGRRFGWPPG